MTKLHELLAVEPDLRAQAEACRSDLKNTFEKKLNHFSEKIVTFKPNEEGKPEKVEGQLKLQTTVKQELKWIGEKLAKHLDVGYQVDTANCVAKADVVLEDGEILLKDVPTTALLRLEHRVSEIKDLVHAIPTLDPAKGFEPDPSMGPGVFKARDQIGTRTEKRFEFIVMVPPTDKHPAQVKELSLDKPIGTIEGKEWSSLISVADKAAMLDRVEVLMRAVKKARSKANDVEIEVSANKIGKKVLHYVFGA